jgi:hypothetical protein
MKPLLIAALVQVRRIYSVVAKLTAIFQQKAKLHGLEATGDESEKPRGTGEPFNQSLGWYEVMVTKVYSNVLHALQESLVKPLLIVDDTE